MFLSSLCLCVCVSGLHMHVPLFQSLNQFSQQLEQTLHHWRAYQCHILCSAIGNNNMEGVQTCKVGATLVLLIFRSWNNVW